MQTDFFFNPPDGVRLNLGEDYSQTSSTDNGNYLISNVTTVPTEIYAPEINFYLRCSQESETQKVAGVKKLYEIRATTFELALQTEMTVQVGKRVLIVSGWDQTQLRYQLGALGFDVLTVDSSQVLGLEIKESGLRVKVQEGDTQLVLETDQLLWGNCPGEYKCWRGIHDHEFLGHDKSIAAVQSGTGTVSYRNYVKHEKSLCLYQGKRKQICGQCADICPTGAIKRETAPNKLRIAHLECIGCGACVGGCPTGAMDSARMPRSAFTGIRNILEGYSTLLIPADTDFESLSVELGEKVLPLVIEDESMLDEWHLLSLLQTSGMPALYYNEAISPITENVIRVINDIFTKKFDRPAVTICFNPDELTAAASKLSPFGKAQYDLDERSLNKRQIMAKRLAYLVGSDDLGTALTHPYLHYGMLRLNQDNCTLCLSCAAGCTTKALTVHPENNTLQFTPSLCCSCNYCVTSCPEENCLQSFTDQLVLHPEFFKRRIVARDDLFKCLDCGRPYAPAKSVNRIAEMMKPQFKGDHLRIRTLYCCPDCKAKVMLGTLTPDLE